MKRILTAILLIASPASAGGKDHAAIAIARACPAMQKHWPDYQIKCADLEATREPWGWIVMRKGVRQHLHWGPVARLDLKLKLMDTVYLGS